MHIYRIMQLRFSKNKTTDYFIKASIFILFLTLNNLHSSGKTEIIKEFGNIYRMYDKN